MQQVNQAAERELEQLGAVILAAEPWAKEYEKDPDTHATLIKQETKLETALRTYLRELVGERVDRIVDWWAYTNEAVRAYDVNTIIVDDNMAAEEGLLLTVMYDPIAGMMETGAQAGEAIYNAPLGITQLHPAVQTAARKYTSKLVTGINNTTRDRIRQSISTSLSLGEDQKTASIRLNKVVRDYKRSELIARTEAVNSYSQGLDVFGVASGAKTKTWQAIVGACPICSPLDGVEVPINGNFPGIDRPGPTAHPNCRCGKVLNYEN